MKLTWFGGTTLRIYIGGEIVVIDAAGAPSGIAREELLAGADQVTTLAEPSATQVDPATWKAKLTRPLDPVPPVELLGFGPSTLLISAPGEPPLLVADTPALPALGRWVDGAVIVLFGERGAALALAIEELGRPRPKLLALAADEPTLDALFAKLGATSDAADGVNLAALEPGLALEV